MSNENGHRGPNPDIPAATASGALSEPSAGKNDSVRSAVATTLGRADDGLVIANRNFPRTLGNSVVVFKGRDGNAYVQRLDDPRLPVLRVGSSACNAFLMRLARTQEKSPRAADIKELNETLGAHAELNADVREVHIRIAPVPRGFEYYLADAAYTRVLVTADGVHILEGGSETLFAHPPRMKAQVRPAETGDWKRLYRYINLSDPDKFLLVTWILYTLAHPKLPTTVYPILVLFGGQGSGKSVLCRMIAALIDPSQIGLRTFPRSERDLAIAAQQTHLLMFDNLRSITPVMSDWLCIAATGGAFSTRRLYSDMDEVDLELHVAIVLNGIVPFVDQPDLAQRCLPLTLRTIDASGRRDEATLFRELEADLPVIFRGLLDRAAGALRHLDSVEVIDPERVIDFSRFLAALELHDGVPAGVYQAQYSDCIRSGMLDSLESHPLGAAVLQFVDGVKRKGWQGTPTDLLDELERWIDFRGTRSPEWPSTPNALSKRLQAMETSLLRQGVEVRLWRSHERMISLRRVAGGAA